MTTTLALHRTGYFLLTTDDEELVEHLSMHKKIEVVSVLQDVVMIRTQERHTKSGSRLTLRNDGLYMSTLRLPPRSSLEPFGKVEAQAVTLKGPGCVFIQLPSERPKLVPSRRRKSRVKVDPPAAHTDRPRLKDLVGMVNSYKRKWATT